MCKRIKNFDRLPVLYLAIIIPLFLSCNKEDDEDPQVQETTYAMSAVSDPGISGEVTFRKQSESSTLVIIQLVGTSGGNIHPTHIHRNSFSEGGPIIIDLTSLDGATGRSETTVTALDDGTPITYEELLAFNGHARVHLSPTAMATLIAEGDIGANGTGY